jgi:CDP-diacylglycerol--serine O-phosphatidyltransferase
MSSVSPRKPFSMIREFHLADWFTLGNAICGTAALFSTITFVQTGRVVHMYLACALVCAALAFDILDGRIARWRQKTSAMAYFVACGVSRLARYNVTVEEMSGGTGKVKFFEGTPIPTSFLVVFLLTYAAWNGAAGEQMWLGKAIVAGHVFHPLSMVFFVSGSLMISRIPIPKL